MRLTRRAVCAARLDHPRFVEQQARPHAHSREGRGHLGGDLVRVRVGVRVGARVRVRIRVWVRVWVRVRVRSRASMRRPGQG